MPTQSFLRFTLFPPSSLVGPFFFFSLMFLFCVAVVFFLYLKDNNFFLCMFFLFMFLLSLSLFFFFSENDNHFFFLIFFFFSRLFRLQAVFVLFLFLHLHQDLFFSTAPSAVICRSNSNHLLVRLCVVFFFFPPFLCVCVFVQHRDSSNTCYAGFFVLCASYSEKKKNK